MAKKETKVTVKKTQAKRPQSPWMKYIPHAILFIGAFILYGNTLKNEYALDDTIVITSNQFTKQGTKGLKRIFNDDTFTGYFGERRTLVEGGRYRPLSLATFAIEEQLLNNDKIRKNPALDYKTNSNPNLVGFRHFVNVFLFAITCVLLYTILVSLIGNGKGGTYLSLPFLASMMFMAHPIHTEVVANIKSRDELMALFFGLVCLALCIKAVKTNNLVPIFISAITFFLALLSKENGATFILLIPLALFLFIKPKANYYAAIFGSYLVPLLLFLYLRSIALAPISQPPTTQVDKPYREILNDPFIDIKTKETLPYSERAAICFTTYAHYARLLVFPHPLTNDYYFNQIPVNGWNATNIISLLAVLALFGIGVIGIKKWPILSFSIFMFAIPFALVSNLFISIGVTMAERFLFMSSVGFCIAFTWLIMVGTEKIMKGANSRILISFFAFLVITFSYKTISRNPAWKDDFTLFSADVNTSSNSAKVQTSYGANLNDKAVLLGNAEEKQAVLDSAIVHFKRAIEIYPDHGMAWMGLGTTYYHQSKLTESLKAFKEAVKFRPSLRAAWQNYGAVAALMGLHKESAYAKLQYVARVKDPQVWVEAASELAMDSTRSDSAIWAAKEALKINPTFGKAYAQLGLIYGRDLHQFNFAIDNYLQAKKVGYHEADLYENLGVAYAFNGNTNEAIKIFNEGLKVHPNSVTLLRNLSETYRRLGMPDEVQKYENRITQLTRGK